MEEEAAYAGEAGEPGGGYAQTYFAEEEGGEEQAALAGLSLREEGGEVRHNPGEHYAGVAAGEALPDREVTQTDHLNAKLLSAFDRLLSEGAFKIQPSANDSAWNDQDDE